MSMNLFLESAKNCALELRRRGFSEGMVIHHDEADGLCSAAIVKAALEREGICVRLLCLDKLFPEVVEKVHSYDNKLYVYTDIGSAHVSKISRVNRSRNFAIILDHHDTEQVEDPSIFNLNPELYGFSGERDASASAVAYVFSVALSEANRDLAHLALIGSAEIPGPMVGINLYALEDAIRSNSVSVVKGRSGEDYKILKLGKPLSYKRYATLLSVLGSVGYFAGGPELGVKACLQGFNQTIEKIARGLEDERKQIFKELINELRSRGLRRHGHIQWFHAGDRFLNMSGKVLGSFCSYLSYQRFVDPKLYLVGAMNMRSHIPGFGDLERRYVKVSARAPEALRRLIAERKMPPLSVILPRACEEFGGFGDGHAVAASGVMLKGREEEFIRFLDELARER